MLPLGPLPPTPGGPPVTRSLPQERSGPRRPPPGPEGRQGGGPEPRTDRLHRNRRDARPPVPSSLSPPPPGLSNRPPSPQPLRPPPTRGPGSRGGRAAAQGERYPFRASPRRTTFGLGKGPTSVAGVRGDSHARGTEGVPAGPAYGGEPTGRALTSGRRPRPCPEPARRKVEGKTGPFHRGVNDVAGEPGSVRGPAGLGCRGPFTSTRTRRLLLYLRGFLRFVK